MRKIIIQERANAPSDFNFYVAFWVAVPAQRQAFYADANKTSTVKDITAPELSALQAGEFVEIRELARYVAGTSVPTIKADLIAKFNAHQTDITNSNPWQYYGTYWDGTAWTNNSIT